MKTHIFYRSDFKADSNGDSYFDSLLDSLGIPEEKQPSIDTIDISVTRFSADNEDGDTIIKENI